MRKNVLLPVMLMLLGFFHSAFPFKFTMVQLAGSSNNTCAVYVVDLDKDGDLDILSADKAWGRISWHKNNGSVSFTQYIIGEDDNMGAVSAVDLDNDGDLDVVTPSTWFENKGTTPFTHHGFADATYEESVHAVDLDNDGDIDIISSLGSSVGLKKIYWFKNDGTNDFTSQTIYTYSIDKCYIQPYDIDDDNDFDLIIADNYQNKIVWLENDGAGSFAEHSIDDGAREPTGLFIADIDGDGKKEFLTTVRSSTSTSYRNIVYYKRGSTGSFTRRIYSHSGGYIETMDFSSLCVSDIDYDGKPDVVLACKAGVYWFKNGGSGSSTNVYTIRSGMEKECSVAAADMDDDHDVDVVSASGYTGTADKVTVFESDHSLSLTAPGRGAEWLFGEERSITWNTNGRFLNVKISCKDYKKDHDNEWKVITASTANDGSFDWTIPGITSDSCKISISDADDARPRVYSEYFGIYSIPDAPVLGKPDDDATNVSTAPVVEWELLDGARTYTLQISTESDFSSLTFDTSAIRSTSVQVKELRNDMTYYWRVNAVNPAGAGDWSSVRSFTTIIGAPDAPVPDSPSDNAVDQPVTPALKWNKVSRAFSYSLQVSASSGFSSTIVNRTGLTDTLLQVNNLINSAKYYWRVKAKNDGGTSDWSTVWNFTTVMGAPDAPVLADPSNNQTNTPVNPVLKWHTSGDAASYALQISTTSDFSGLVTDESGITDTSISISGLSNNTTYFWRVNGTNSAGTGAWSVPRSFTTVMGTPDAPVLASPAGNAVNRPVTSTLKWKKVSGASYYQLQVSSKSDFSNPIFHEGGLTDTAQQVNNLANGTVYYWRVKAENNSGASDWSTVGTFTTIPAASAAPSPAEPSNNATNISVTPVIKWHPSEGASTYALQVSTVYDFSSLVMDESGISDTLKSVSGLANSTRYYWRVNAANPGGTGDWSNARSFTTIIDKPDVPALLSPDNGSTDVTVTVQFRWKPATNAESYHLHLSTSKSFNDATGDTSGLTDTVFEVSGLSNETRYYWRVRAVNESGTGAWSTVCSLTTIVALPQAVAPISPTSDDVITSDSLRFVWNAGKPQVTTYRIDIAKDSLFTDVIITDSTITDTLKIVEAAEKGKFWWRVCARNPAGWGEWCEAGCYTIDKTTRVVLPEGFRIAFNNVSAGNGRIDYALPKTADVCIRLYTPQGKVVSDLVNRVQVPGYYSVELNSRSSGCFILLFKADNFVSQKKLLIMQ